MAERGEMERRVREEERERERGEEKEKRGEGNGSAKGMERVERGRERREMTLKGREGGREEGREREKGEREEGRERREGGGREYTCCLHSASPPPKGQRTAEEG